MASEPLALFAGQVFYERSRMLKSYIQKQYPQGKVRVALKDHLCNGNPDGHDPGCGRPINEGDSYFDTGVRNEFFEAGRFCKRCAMLEPISFDLFIEA